MWGADVHSNLFTVAGSENEEKEPESREEQVHRPKGKQRADPPIAGASRRDGE
jgi:hypothetical protein